MPPADRITIEMEDVKLIYRNFAGREQMFNNEGDRNFCVVLDKALADKMSADGFSVKLGKPDEDAEEDEIPDPYVKVKVSYKFRPPTVVLIAGEGGPRTYLSETSVETLDYAEIEHADIVVHSGKPWQRANGDMGISAYLQAAYITIKPDRFAQKYDLYANPPSSNEE
jgi:hypothetical protein